jgi:succinate dehydrogenase/fumarate reductase-like Fe-S protein
MKLKILSMAFFLMLSVQGVFAQDVTDEELKKYAVVMDSIDDMKADLIEAISEMVKNHEKISAARYNELSKIIGDEAKLAEAEAKPEEIEAVREILKFKEDGTAKIQETFKTLASEYVGAAVFNKVKKAIAENAEAKAKYQEILAELNKEDS